MSLLLKALRRLETSSGNALASPPIDEPPPSDEPLATVEAFSTAVEQIADDAGEQPSGSFSIEADPTLWDAELPLTSGDPSQAAHSEPLSPESLPDVILWPEEISALSADEASFRAEIDDLSMPANLDPTPAVDAPPEADLYAPELNLPQGDSSANESTSDEPPATIPYVAQSDDTTPQTVDVATISTVVRLLSQDIAEQLPAEVLTEPSLAIFSGNDPAPANTVEDIEASPALQSSANELQSASNAEPIVEEIMPSAVEQAAEYVLKIAPVHEGEELQLDRAALGARLSELRMQGLCENIASQITATVHPVVLLVPTLPLLGLETLAVNLAKQFVARLGEMPRILDLGTRDVGASLNPILHLEDARRESALVMLTADSAESLSLAAWLPECDAVYLIVDLQTTPRRAVYDAIEQLARRDSRLAGCILLDAA